MDRSILPANLAAGIFALISAPAVLSIGLRPDYDSTVGGCLSVKAYSPAAMRTIATG
jgi:hypothetical protein